MLFWCTAKQLYNPLTMNLNSRNHLLKMTINNCRFRIISIPSLVLTLIPTSHLLMPPLFVNWFSNLFLSTRSVTKLSATYVIDGSGILLMSISILLTSLLTVYRSSSDGQMWCRNALLASKQRWPRLFLVIIPLSVLSITAKVSPLTSPSLVSSQRIPVEEKIMLVLMVRLVGSWLPTIILVCNMVRLVEARHLQLNGYGNGCKSIALI